MKIDINYCFMDDVMEGFTFRPEYFINARNGNDRKMGDGSGKVIPYEDPDALSRKLYEALKAIWGRVLGLEEIVWDENYDCYYFSNKSDGMQYSSDYIGPSATRAFQMGIDELTVGTAIKECRTIGGHMIWPRHTANVNTSRGNAACDRIDITLLEIKDFYESNSIKKREKRRTLEINQIIMGKYLIHGIYVIIDFMKKKRLVWMKSNIISGRSGIIGNKKELMLNNALCHWRYT